MLNSAAQSTSSHWLCSLLDKAPAPSVCVFCWTKDKLQVIVYSAAQNTSFEWLCSLLDKGQAPSYGILCWTKHHLPVMLNSAVQSTSSQWLCSPLDKVPAPSDCVLCWTMHQLKSDGILFWTKPHLPVMVYFTGKSTSYNPVCRQNEYQNYKM